MLLWCEGGRGVREGGLEYWIQVPLAVINMTDQKHSTMVILATSRAVLSKGWTPGAVITQGLQRDISGANGQDGWANYFSSTQSCTAAQQHGRAFGGGQSPGEKGWTHHGRRRAHTFFFTNVHWHWSEKWLHSLFLACVSGLPLAEPLGLFFILFHFYLSVLPAKGWIRTMSHGR